MGISGGVYLIRWIDEAEESWEGGGYITVERRRLSSN